MSTTGKGQVGTLGPSGSGPQRSLLPEGTSSATSQRLQSATEAGAAAQQDCLVCPRHLHATPTPLAPIPGPPFHHFHPFHIGERSCAQPVPELR